jgi:pantoate--beta-alanine ligase
VGKGNTFNLKISVAATFNQNSMILFRNIAQIRQHVYIAKKAGNTIGFVPTMGALHQGHISLINASKKAGCLSIASIFVNPTQFNNPSDFAKYPKTLEQDIELLEMADCDFLFLPSVEEMYPPNQEASLLHYPLGRIENLLEGKYRPGHFQGVCMVMDKLLRIVEPHHLFMGQKDYQQCMVVQSLIHLLQLPVQLHTCSTLREKDGLAMSSRNMRLNPTQRKNAAGIYQSLNFLKEKLHPGPLDSLIEKSISMLMLNHFKVDYVSIADANSLEPCTDWDGQQKLVALAAAFQDDIRLIDNLLLN